VDGVAPGYELSYGFSYLGPARENRHMTLSGRAGGVSALLLCLAAAPSLAAGSLSVSANGEALATEGFLAPN
jgi:hypothetical protein